VHVHAADAAGAQGDHGNVGAGRLERRRRRAQFHLLEAIRGEHGNALAGK
jgi:hypothetical protein